MKTASPTSETDIILLAIAKEKLSFARLAAAAQACDNPKAKRLYNQLALDELKHLLTLVSLMDGLADDWLTRMDLTVPLSDDPELLPQTEEAILRSTMEEESDPPAISAVRAGSGWAGGGHATARVAAIHSPHDSRGASALRSGFR